MTISRRRLIRDRAEGRCEYCHLPDAFDVQPFQLALSFGYYSVGVLSELSLFLSTIGKQADP